MKRKFDAELAAGFFVIAGLVCLAYLSIRLGRMEVLGRGGYEVYARFTNSGGLKAGSAVVIAGVQIGRVKAVTLDDYEAHVVLDLDRGVKVHVDSIASIRTRGLIGEKYVEISPGGSDQMVGPGERIRDTEPALDLEALISRMVFGGL